MANHPRFTVVLPSSNSSTVERVGGPTSEPQHRRHDQADPRAGQSEPSIDEQVIRALRSYTRAVDSYVQAMGRGHEMHRTDLSALAVVMDATSRGELVTPRGLSRAVRISPSAMSALLDRLEQAGHLTRRPHPDDRRSVVVEITDTALATGGAIFGPVGRATAAVMAQYSEEELRLVARFLDEVAAVTETLAAGPSASPSP